MYLPVIKKAVNKCAIPLRKIFFVKMLNFNDSFEG